MKKIEFASEVDRLNILDNYIQKELKKAGLDFHPVEFDIVSSEKMAEIMAYNMPCSFSHWSFGRDFEKVKTIWQHTRWRLPYEIYFSPGRALIADTDPFIVKLLTVAHVYAHSDFAKNSAMEKTQRQDMTTYMARARDRFRQYKEKYGQEVKETITCAMALMLNIDPFAPRRISPEKQLEKKLAEIEGKDPNADLRKVRKNLTKKFPFSPDRDILAFLIEHAPDLEEWQKDILTVIRELGYYYYPITQTRIINEGWAAYWHEWMIHNLFQNQLITPEEFDEFAKINSSVLAELRTNFNPYLMGAEIWRDLEKRQGKEKIFQVRSAYSDWLFIDEFLTDEIIDKSKLYIWQKIEIGTIEEWVIMEKRPKVIREQIVQSLRRYPIPLISVTMSDYQHKGELYLVHNFDEEAEGLEDPKMAELDPEYARKTLEHIFWLWGAPVWVETKKIKKDSLFPRKIVYGYDGKKHKEEEEEEKKNK